jgi:TonB family protein
MSGKDKNGNDQASDFLRYHGNEMRDKERNDFERNLQKDPFASEASEGFESIDPSRVKNDLLKIRKQLKKRTSGKPKMVWYRIAASVAVLMILSTIFIFVRREEPSEQISYTPVPRISKDIQVSKSQDKQDESAGLKEQAAMPAEKSNTEPVKIQKYETKSGRQPDIRKEEVSETNPEAIIVAQAEKPDQIKAIEDVMAPEPVMAKRTSGYYTNVRGRIISSEDNQPLPGVSVSVKGTDKGTITDAAGNFSLGAEDASNKMLVANFVGMETKEFKAVKDSSMEIKLEPSLATLNEIVVVGYGVKADEYYQENELTGYIPPFPENGKADFDKYIRENLRRPDTATAGQRVVVVLNFRVDLNGKIDSIKVIRSPGKMFSDEAVRLIKEGPAWKPAEENGKVINDEVRIRIVFK